MTSDDATAQKHGEALIEDTARDLSNSALLCNAVRMRHFAAHGCLDSASHLGITALCIVEDEFKRRGLLDVDAEHAEAIVEDTERMPTHTGHPRTWPFDRD